MNKKINALVASAVLGMTLLTGCGEEEVATTPEVQQYAQQQNPAAQTQNTNTQTATQTQNTATTPAATTPTATKPAATTGTTASTSTSATVTTPAASATASATANLSVAQKLMLKSKQNYEALKNYSATITMYSKRNDKLAPSANPVVNMEFKYTFQPPRIGVFNVIKHNISLVVGAKMVWKGGDSATVKASGVLGLFPTEMKLNDSKMSTNREWRFNQLDHIAIVERGNDPKATLELAGKTTIGGKEAYMIKVKGVGLDSEITEEHIALDAKTFLILADEMYAGTDMVFQLKMNVESTNATLPADLLEL